MTVSITRCWRSVLSAWLIACWLGLAHAGSIEPTRAQLLPTEDGYALSAEFDIDLGPRLEEAVSRGVPLHFNLEFTLTRARWYWADEHVTGRHLAYRLSYSALTRQYRLSLGSLHQNLDSLAEALRVLGRVGRLAVADRGALKPGENYTAALRLSLDRSQLPKPFQVDAIANRDWQVDAKILRWQFTAAGEAK